MPPSFSSYFNLATVKLTLAVLSGSTFFTVRLVYLTNRFKMKFCEFLFFFILAISLCYAKVEGGAEANNVSPSEKTANSTVPAPAEKQPYISSLQSSFLPADLSWKVSFGQALVYVGAAAFSFVLVGGLTLLIAPLFGYKICALLGNCEPIVTTYSAGGNLQNPAQANSYSDYYGTYYATAPYATYQKRSLDYIKPIIETLASAYEKRNK